MSESALPEIAEISVEVDVVATICLDRPAKHNALTPEMLMQLEQILIDIDTDRMTRVVVVTAAGDRSFCAGADIKRFKVLEPLDMWAQWTRLGHRVFDRLAGLRQPTIAAVSGNAYGGGFELALACDLRIVADDATLGLTEVNIGALPGWGGTGRLRDLVGTGRAKELIFTGMGGCQPANAQGRRDQRRRRLGEQDRQSRPHRRTDGQTGDQLRRRLCSSGASQLRRHRLY